MADGGFDTAAAAARMYPNLTPPPAEVVAKSDTALAAERLYALPPDSAQQPPAPELPAEGEAPAADQAKPDDAADAQAQPSDETDTRPAAEQVDAQVLKHFNRAASEAGLAPAAAEKLLNEMLPTMRRRGQEQLAEQRSKWIEQAHADVELRQHGGLDRSLADARAAVQRFGDDDLRALLDSTGLGDHPLMLKVFARVGRATKGFRTPAQ